MSAIQRGKTEENNGLRALIDELYARTRRGADAGGTQYVFVYQPGGSDSVNVYTDFNRLYEALDAAAPASESGTRPSTLILVDDSFVLPSPTFMPPRRAGGAYNFNNVTWEAVSNPLTGSAGAEIVLQEGVIINGGSPTANLTMSLRGNIEFTNNTTHDVITCSDPAQIIVINQEQNTNLQSDAGGRMLKCTAGAIFVFMIGDSTLSDGIHTALECAGGSALVQAFGNSYVGPNGMLGAGCELFWDTASPGAQGAGVVVKSVFVAESSVALVNGANEDVAIPAIPGSTRNNMFVRIDGPTAAFSIGGLACDGGNRGGQRVTLYSAVNAPLTVNFADAGSAAANRIYNPAAGPVLIGQSFYANFTVQYDSSLPGWILVDYVTDDAIAANHVQGNTANAVAANPVLSPTIAFTCKGPNKKVHVEVTAYPVNGTGTLVTAATMTLLLDGAAVVGAPTPSSVFVNAAPVGLPFGGPITMTWDVTFPDNAAHTLGVQVATAATLLSLGDGTIHAQELLA